MQQNVKIKIKGIHGQGKDSQTITSECEGVLTEMKGRHFLRYTERDEESGQERKALVKVDGKTVTLEYKGATDSVMIFEVGKKNRSSYVTPMGSMVLETVTKSLEIAAFESGMDIKIDYLLGLGGGPMQRTKIIIEARN